jgi:hypothetical protein
VLALDRVADDPAIAVCVSREEAAALLMRAMTCCGALVARLMATAAPTDTGTSASIVGGEAEGWLSADEVARRFGLSARWLSAHRRVLAGRRIISRPSRKTAVYHAKRLARFLEERSQSPGM